MATKEAQSVSNTTGTQEDSSRRNILRGMAVAGAGAGIGLFAAPKADAATNDAMLAGKGVFATNMTYLGNNAAAGSYATASLTTEPTMFWADNRTSTINGNGVRGDGHGTGSGLWGNSDFNGTGVLGTGAAGAIGVKAVGGRANLQVVPGGAPPRSRSDAHSAGEVVADAAGDLWCCVAGGNPGTWRKLAGASSAGQFHVLGAPVRAYDSRSGDGALGGGDQRNIVMTGVPAGASAVTVSLTATQTAGSGYLSLFRSGITWPGNSNLNWFASGQTVAVTTISAVNASRVVAVRAGGTGSTQFIIDVIGYYS